jgi:uncharacterized protein DUF4347/fibronectin type III domain protein/exosortase sorting signal-containing protein
MPDLSAVLRRVALWTAVVGASVASAHALDTQGFRAGSIAGFQPLAGAVQENPRGRHEIVFVAGDVEDWQSLVAGLHAGMEVIRLDRGKDGIAQITDVLAHRSRLDGVHIVSHGAPSRLMLGAGGLSPERIGQHAAALRTWRRALNPQAGLLFYGCDVARGEAGRRFVAQLARATSLAVAASDNATGARSLGGDWTLEVRSSAMRTVALQMPSYAGLLAPLAPTATTNAATAISATGATLNGTVNDNGAITSVSFDYGTTTGYGTNRTATTGATVAAGAGNTAAAVSITGLSCNTTYHFRVKATNSAGTTGGSDRTFTTTACVPTAPRVPSAAAGDGTVGLGFLAPVSNGGAAIITYTATASPGGATLSCAGPSACPMIFTGLTNGVAYTFTVRATNSAGTGPASVPSNSATPMADQEITFNDPGTQDFGTTPTLIATSDSGLPVTFTSSTPGVCTVTSGGTLGFITTGTCTINADQAGDTGTNPAAQVSNSFTVAAVVPGAPAIGTATAGGAQASVGFSAPAFDGGATITGYTAISNPGGITGTSTTSPVTVTGLANGTAYTFTVRATNAAGTGGASAASNSVVPKGSQTLTFANPGTQNFGTAPTLSATADSGLVPTFTSSTTGVCTVTSAGVLTFLSIGTCTIQADQAGNGSYLPAPQVSRSFAVNAVAPGAPTVGTATAGNGQASVTFAAPAFTGGAAITGYTVTSNPGGITATGTASPITVTGLVNGTGYTFTVAATNSAGTGSTSAASNSVTPQPPAVHAACGSAVGAPTAFKPSANLCSAGSAGPVALLSSWSWTCSGANGGADAQCSVPRQSTATSTGQGHAVVSGGSWAVDAAQSAGFIPVTGHPKSPPGLPANVSFPHGLFDVTLNAGTAGSAASVVITFPATLPPGSVYWKYGRTAGNPVPHWYVFPGAVFSGNTVTLTIQDGQDGDDDRVANSVITDPGGPGVSSAPSGGMPGVPALSRWSFALLTALLGFLGWRNLYSRA